LTIRISYSNISWRVRKWKKLRAVLSEIFTSYNLTPAIVDIIVVGNNEILAVNKEFLNHNYYTDVITFSEKRGREVSGEIYISIETVKTNSYNYNVSLKEEFSRVAIHGVLHMCGFEDKTNKQRAEMSKQEDFWLSKL
jgi:rRNA maturation RNase YbeY